MNLTYCRRNVRASWPLCALLVALVLPASAQAYKDRPAEIEASGDGALFDVKATNAGTLKVCTKAGRAGDRWRVTISEATKPNSASAPSVASAVGTGSRTAFTGCASRTVVRDAQYIVAVTWDRPLPGVFLPSSARVTVRFTGGTNGVDPPVVGIPPSCAPGTGGCNLANIIQRPNRWPEPPAGCPADGSSIGCEALLACEFNPRGDTDSFKVTLPANADLSINIAGPTFSAWKIFDPDGDAVNPSGCTGQCEVALTGAGRYTIQTYNGVNNTGGYRLSLLGISTALRCGPRAIPGGSPIVARFDLGGDTDSYLLDNVAAGQVHSITVAGPTFSAWQIFDPSGNALNPSGCTGTCQITLPRAGGYTIKVYNGVNNSGSYTLSLQRVSE